MTTTPQRPGLTGLSARLRALTDQGHLRYIGRDGPDGPPAVELTDPHRIREYPGDVMLDWVDGFGTGLMTGAEPLRRIGSAEAVQRRAAIASLRGVLVNPNLTDQARILVRVAMEEQGYGVMALADRAGVTKKALTELLHLRTSGTLGALVVLGLLQGANPELAEADPKRPVTPHPPRGWREFKALSGLRALAYAHEQGVLTWAEPVPANNALHVRTFDLRAHDGEVHQVRSDALRTWIVGYADAVSPQVASALYDPPNK